MRAKTTIYLGLLIVCFCLTACRSKGIDVTIQNNASVPIRNLEVDYPGAAFGTPIIEPGKSFWYHIKPTNDGAISIAFDTENARTFRQKGPVVQAGKMGRILIIVEQDAKQQWNVRAQSLSQP